MQDEIKYKKMSIKILFIDNRDSFAYNIVELLRQLDTELDIVSDIDTANNELIASITNGDVIVRQLVLSKYDGIVLSPGAGIPTEYSIMQSVLSSGTTTPILGICLGLQAIAEEGGAKLMALPHPLHGHQSHLVISADNHFVFNNIPQHNLIGRYHSWTVAPQSIASSQIQVIAYDEDGNIQAIQHKLFPWVGLQFHPESIITSNGKEIIKNWLSALNKNC